MSISESKKDMLLVSARKTAREMAYCPYSKFHVGCALVSEDDTTYVGCNIENASYGLTICSERCAIFNMVAGGGKKFKVLAVACPDARPADPAGHRMPCGACRQVMAEFAADGAIVIVDGVGEFTIEQLLPNAFRL